MSHPYIHAESSAKLFGGVSEDYIELHNWFDATKAWHPDWRHRAFRHHTEGIQEFIEEFGERMINSEGNAISTYDLGIQHVTEDVGFIPTVEDWFEHFNEEEWRKFRQKRIEERMSSQKAGDGKPQVMIQKLNEGGHLIEEK